MSPFPALSLTAAAIVAAAVLCAGPVRAESQTEIDVVSNLSKAGSEIEHPSVAHPVYYLPVMSGFMQPIHPVGFGENPPPASDVAHTIALTLSHQGYLMARPGLRVNAKLEIAYADGTVVMVPSDPWPGRPIHLHASGNIPLTVAMIESADGPYSFRLAHQHSHSHHLAPLIQVFRTIDPIHGPVMQAMPAIVLVIQWGELHPGGNGGRAAGGLDMPVWLAMLAGDHFNPLTDTDVDELFQRTSADRYFVVVSAFDFKSCLNGQKKKLLWRTRMSVPSNMFGERFAHMLPMLLTAGEAQLGRETRHPIFSEVPLTKEGSVSIGTPVVKDYEEVPPTIPDVGSDRFLPLKFKP